MGLEQAGFDYILGVDIEIQNEYPFSFMLQDVLKVSPRAFKRFDFIWASPPCQAYSCATLRYRNSKNNRHIKYPELIEPTRKLLLKTKKPFVIENVCNAPIKKDLILCGQMFGLKIIRDRAFEIHGFKVPPPALFKEIKSGSVKNGHYITVAGHGGDGSNKLKDWQEAMGIDWITNKKMLAEAVPPAYAKYIGEQFLKRK